MFSSVAFYKKKGNRQFTRTSNPASQLDPRTQNRDNPPENESQNPENRSIRTRFRYQCTVFWYISPGFAGAFAGHAVRRPITAARLIPL